MAGSLSHAGARLPSPQRPLDADQVISRGAGAVSTPRFSRAAAANDSLFGGRCRPDTLIGGIGNEILLRGGQG